MVNLVVGDSFLGILKLFGFSNRYHIVFILYNNFTFLLFL